MQMPSPCRVLLVDDAGDHRLLLRIVLEQEGGFDVVAEAADGEQAIAEARAHRPDVVVLDLRMPRLDGIEALRAIRSASPGSRILVLTAVADVATQATVLALGADGILPKGIEGRSLIEAVAALAPAAA